MAIVKYIIILFLFFFCTLIQVSFLPFFALEHQVPNLVLILFFTLVFFDGQRPHGDLNSFSLIQEFLNPRNFFYAFVAGFFLDIFSDRPLGFSMIVTLGIHLLVVMS